MILLCRAYHRWLLFLTLLPLLELQVFLQGGGRGVKGWQGDGGGEEEG